MTDKEDSNIITTKPDSKCSKWAKVKYFKFAQFEDSVRFASQGNLSIYAWFDKVPPKHVQFFWKVMCSNYNKVKSFLEMYGFDDAWVYKDTYNNFCAKINRGISERKVPDRYKKGHQK